MNQRRLESDRDRVRALAAKAPHLLKIEKEIGAPPTEYLLRLNCRGAAPSMGAASAYRDTHLLRIQFGAGYPFEEPSLRFETPVLHPHVFDATYRVCLGHWAPTEFLDLLVVRMFKLVQMDPSFINAHSLASHAAYEWVQRHRRQLPLGTEDPSASRPVPPPTIRFTMG